MAGLDEGDGAVGATRILECYTRATPVGKALLVQFERVDGAVMGFAELWRAFEQRYPGRWAVQAFPPRHKLIDQRNRYHLWVLPEGPCPFDLFTR